MLLVVDHRFIKIIVGVFEPSLSSGKVGFNELINDSKFVNNVVILFRLKCFKRVLHTPTHHLR